MITDYAFLKNEIELDPANLGYAAMLAARAPGAVVERLNEKIFTMHKETMISDRGLAKKWKYGPLAAEAFLQKLEAVAANAGADLGAALIKRQIKWFATTEGFDVGDPIVIHTINSLPAETTVTAQDKEAFAELSLYPASRAEVLFGPSTNVSIDDLLKAEVI